MNSQNHNLPIGWPLGLDILASGLGLIGNSEAVAVEPQLESLLATSSSFSSLSSSALETESSASFFRDRSVPLGRLIGIKPGDEGRLYFTNSFRYEGPRMKSGQCDCPDLSEVHRVEVSQGICLPVIVGILVRINRNKNRSRY